jgi:hypothetical protein
VHGQFATVVVVLPPTVAVKVCICPAITIAEAGLTVTVITFTLLELLQPPKRTAVHANATTTQFRILRHTITHFSPIAVPRVSPADLVTESRLMNLMTVPSSLACCSILTLAPLPDRCLAASFTTFLATVPSKKTSIPASC